MIAAKDGDFHRLPNPDGSAKTPHPEDADSLGTWKGDVEGRAFAKFGLNPNASLVAADDLAADRQAHAAAGSFVARLQAFENSEDFFRILGIDSDSVVTHREEPLLPGVVGGNMHPGGLRGSIPNRIHQQILKQSDQLDGVPYYPRQRPFARNDRATFLDQGADVPDRIVQGIVATGGRKKIGAARINPRKVQQIMN
jgi:hypothetical protein